MAARTVEEIVDGPCKFDLMVSLFRWDSTVSFRTSQHRFEVKITMLERKDALADELEFRGYSKRRRFTLGKPDELKVSGCFSIRKRQGTISYPADLTA